MKKDEEDGEDKEDEHRGLRRRSFLMKSLHSSEVSSNESSKSYVAIETLERVS